jgi:hypothetical protein
VENQQTPQSAEGEAKVITLCGSTKFEAEFAEVNALTSSLVPRGEKDLEGFDDESVVVELGKA